MSFSECLFFSLFFCFITIRAKTKFFKILNFSFAFFGFAEDFNSSFVTTAVLNV